MATHFTYQHLPASGLGVRDPRRPYVTGGIGGGVPVYITTILEWRIYVDGSRTQLVTDRNLLVRVRDLIVANRDYALSDRNRHRIDRIFADVTLAISTIDRAMYVSDRQMKSRTRDLN